MLRHRSSSTSNSRLPLVPVALVALTALLGGCSGDGGDTSTGTITTTTTETGGSGGSSGTSSTGGAELPDTPKEFFEQVVLPGLMSECGACHQLGGSADHPFMAEPDPYVSIVSWPGVVVEDPAKSIIVVHPNEASHGAGQAPPISEELRAKVLQWLEMEAKNIPEVEGSLVYQVTPFKPILGGALNTIYFDDIDPTLQYASVSFNAKELTDTLLQLKNLEIHPVEGQSIHIVHPLFTVYPKDAAADPDPIDSFSGVDQIFTLDTGDVVLGTGEVILTNWQKDAYLGIAFENIANNGGGGPPAGCYDPVKFMNEVVPQMQYCADTCHGGNNPQANATMDLSQLNADPPDAACAQVRARITPGDPEESQIIDVTDPTQQIQHMYKFAGNKNKYMTFKTAVSPWIISEAQKP